MKIKKSHIIPLTWFLTGGILITLPLAGIGGFGYRQLEAYRTCTYKKNLDDVMHICQNIAGLTSLIIIIICYTLIVIHIRHHFKNRKDHQAEQMASMTTPMTTGGNINREAVHMSCNDNQHDQAEQMASVTTGGNREAVHMSCNDNKLAQINKQELQITKNLFIVMCTFVVCLLPIIISNILTEHPAVYVFYPLFANSALNFVIYACRHPHFKIVLGCILRCRYADIPEPSGVLKAILRRKHNSTSSVRGISRRKHNSTSTV